MRDITFSTVYVGFPSEQSLVNSTAFHCLMMDELCCIKLILVQWNFMHIRCVIVSTPGSGGNEVNESFRTSMKNEIEYLKVLSTKHVTVSNLLVSMN
jgi:hypothetical protein